MSNYFCNFFETRYTSTPVMKVYLFARPHPLHLHKGIPKVYFSIDIVVYLWYNGIHKVYLTREYLLKRKEIGIL